jgi:hypothetical protein
MGRAPDCRGVEYSALATNAEAGADSIAPSRSLERQRGLYGFHKAAE